MIYLITREVKGSYLLVSQLSFLWFMISTFQRATFMRLRDNNSLGFSVEKEINPDKKKQANETVFNGKNVSPSDF